jgi:cephalosporin hydroxylase
MRVLRDVQLASFRYRYRDVPTIKNPFDLALYMMLLSRTHPRTIVEVGSAAGGSALWLASQCRGLEFDTQILSVDLQPPVELSDADDRVTFLTGDAHDLAASPLPISSRSATVR